MRGRVRVSPGKEGSRAKAAPPALLRSATSPVRGGFSRGRSPRKKAPPMGELYEGGDEKEMSKRFASYGGTGRVYEA